MSDLWRSAGPRGPKGRSGFRTGDCRGLIWRVVSPDWSFVVWREARSDYGCKLRCHSQSCQLPNPSFDSGNGHSAASFVRHQSQILLERKLTDDDVHHVCCRYDDYAKYDQNCTGNGNVASSKEIKGSIMKGMQDMILRNLWCPCT